MAFPERPLWCAGLTPWCFPGAFDGLGDDGHWGNLTVIPRAAVESVTIVKV